MAEKSAMAGEAPDTSAVIGVTLVSDGSAQPVANLGVVVSSENATQLSIARLRQLIREQIPLCPASYRFYSQGRWPVSVSQERNLTSKHLLSADGSVSIQQVHSKPKIGLKARTGLALGFVFSDPGLTLAELRSLISQEVLFFHKLKESYHFLDANGWPVVRALEQRTHVWEVLTASCVVVGTDLVPKTQDSYDETDANWSVCSEEPPRKKLKGLRHLSFSSSKDIDRQGSLAITPSPPAPAMQTAVKENTPPDKQKKQLLISYVRAEAADYALHLKIKLAELGYSVYLDVHEISVGVDWQDSLNFAVSNCEVFIPLVTPRYGETLWTNREVKLADVLGKYILPVNFLPEWPPRCLAIQFATTQFVLSGQSHIPALSSNGKTDGKEHGSQLASWTMDDITTAALEICKKLKRVSRPGTTGASAPSLKRMRTLRKTFVGKLPALSKSMSGSDTDLAALGSKSIVICLHPAQAAFGQEVKSWLQGRTVDSFTVWLACDLDFPDRETDTLPTSPAPNSQPEGGFMGEEDVAVGGAQATLFQTEADKAAVVLVILSKEFSASQTCKQQMFYCEQRKPIIPVHLEEFSMPGWLNMLLRTSCSEGVYQYNYRQTLLSRLDRILHSAAREDQEQSKHEAMIGHAVDQIKKTVKTENCVYIAGSTRFRNKKSEDICRAIGVHLARLEDVSVATGGFFGIGETISRAFHEELQHLKQRGDVWHILPDRDVKDYRQRASQNIDGTFAVATFGKTLFFGDSVRQRESIVGRCFEICILVEGGPGAAHEAEEFVWNDRLVIPVSCTGGAASGNFSVPEKMFEIPQGVTEQDWQALRSTELPADEIGQCVARIVAGVLRRLALNRQHKSDYPATPPAPGLATPPVDLTPPLVSPSTVSPQNVVQLRGSLSNRETIILG